MPPRCSVNLYAIVEEGEQQEVDERRSDTMLNSAARHSQTQSLALAKLELIHSLTRKQAVRIFSSS